MIFIGEGLAILFAPRFTLTSFCRRHPWLWEFLDALLDIHRDGFM